MSRRAQSDQGDLRERLLDAALHQFSLSGYDRATLDDIAAAAGVTKGSVYWYFENKRALFIAVGQRETSKLLAHLEEIVQGEGRQATARIEALIVATLTYYTDHPEFCKLLKIFTLPGGPELERDVEAMAAEEYGRARKVFARLLREAAEQGQVDSGRVEVATTMLVALLDGLMYQWIVDPGAVPLRRLAPEISRGYLDGVLRRPT